MKRIITAILTLCIVFTLFAGTYAYAEKPSEDIVILFTNDVHCAVNDNLGYTTLSTVKSALEKAGNTVILADCGDAYQGGAVGTLSKGANIIEIMNHIGYDVACIGNHDFDFGIESFKSNVKNAEFPFLSCNFLDADGKQVLKPYTIFNVNNVKIAFVGISTPKTLVTTVRSSLMNDKGEFIYSFCQDETGEKLYSKVQEAVDAARSEGADYVVALSHLGTELDCTPWTSSDVINNTSGIDVMLDAHSHSVIECEKVKNKDGKIVLLSQGGTRLANIGCLVIGADGSLNTTLINDNGTGELIKDIEAKNNEILKKVVAHTDVDLAIIDPSTGMRMVRQNETNIGDLIADAFRAVSGADVAIINGGAIREAIPAGDITYEQIISVQPFNKDVCVVEATGQEILDALELSASKLPAEFGGFLHVSGMSYTIDMSVDSTVEIDADSNFKSINGARRIKNVMVGDKPIDPDKTYTLTSNSNLLKDQGDGYNMFSDNVFIDECVMIDYEATIKYIQDNLGGTVGKDYADIYGQGRIVIN